MGSPKSKVDYRLKRDFYPLLEAQGFVKASMSREWVKVQNEVLCALMVQPSTVWNPDSNDRVGEEGFLVEVAVTYPMAAYGHTKIIDDVGIAGIGAGADVRGYLQRTEAHPRTTLGYEWDLGLLSPDEVVEDIICAFSGAGRAFFDLWSDPGRAWDELNSTDTPEELSDLGRVWGAQRSWYASVSRIEFFMKVAARLGKVQVLFVLPTSSRSTRQRCRPICAGQECQFADRGVH